MADYRITDLATKLWRGEISRRDFIARATLLGLSATAIGSILDRDASAAPAGSRRLRNGRAQTDATTLVITDSLAGSQWLTLDPGWFFEINSAAAMYLLYDQLYHIPDSNNPTDVQPLLAESLPEFSDDGLTATVKVRQGVKFHRSGNTMTANDVVFSFNRLKNIGYQGSFLGADYWTEVTALDDATVQFTLAAPNAALASVLSALPLSITDSARVKEFGGTDAPPTGDDPAAAPEVKANEDAKLQIDQDSVGTGPYMLVQFDKNSETILERNPDYWGEAPKLERIIWVNTTEVNAELQRVETGEADIATSVASDQVEAVKANPELQLLTGPTLSIEYVGLKVTERGGPLANQQVRQAIAHAIDYDGIINSILGGAADRPAAPVPLGLTGADKVKDQRYTTDLATAQRLWDEAGVGEAEIECIYDSDFPAAGGVTYETLAVKVQSDLQQIKGLTIRLAPMPGAERLAKYRAGDFQMTISPWSPDYPDVDTFATPFGQTETAAAGRVGYSDPEMDQLLKQGLSELDPTKREEIYVKVQEKMIDAAAFLVLYQPTAQKPASAKVQGAATHSVYQINLRNASKTE
jgi:peptide/nickel transport system substrate-binding protein